MAGLGGGGGGGGSGAIRAGRAFVEFSVRDDQFLRGLDRIERRMRELTSTATRVGLGLGAVGVAAAPVVRTFVGFDDAIRTAGAAAEATGAEFARMREVAQQLGRATSFSAVEVAQLMTELARAGFDPSQVEAMTKSILDLSRASGTATVVAAEMVSVVIRAFKLEAKDAARVADGLTAAANKSFSSVTDMGFSLAYAAKTAKDAGLSIEQTLAVLGGLANVGIRGEMAGTTLRRMLLLTGAEAKKMEDIFGVNPADAAGKMRPVVDVLDDVMKSLKGLSDVERTGKLEEFFGILGVTGALSVGDAAVEIRQLQREIEAAGGIAARTAKFMDGGLGGALRRVRGAAEGLAIVFAEALVPALAAAAGGLRSATDWAINFLNNNQQLAAGVAATAGAVALGVAAVSAGVLGVSLSLAAVGNVIGLVTGALSLLAAGVALVLTPLGAVVASLAIYVATWGALTKEGRKAAGTLADAFREISATFKETFEGIGAAVMSGNLELAFKVAAAGIKAVWFDMLRGMARAFAEFLEDNRKRIVQLATLLGAIKGGMVGARAGPWGTAVGVLAGGVATTVGADALVDELVKFGATPGLDARAAAAKAELAALVATAKGGVAAAAGVDPGDPAALDKARFDAYGAKPFKLSDAVKGAFEIPAARQMFGYGDKVGDRALNAAERTAKNTEQAAKALAQLAQAFLVR